MSARIGVARVEVDDEGGTVGVDLTMVREGVHHVHAASIPPDVREALQAWLAPEPTVSEWGVEHDAIAALVQAMGGEVRVPLDVQDNTRGRVWVTRDEVRGHLTYRTEAPS